MGWTAIENGEVGMNLPELFRRACVSGFVCSIFYHGLMLLMGTEVQLRSAVVFTVVFVLLYFLWLLMVSRRGK